jgi:hypothetical protein
VVVVTLELGGLAPRVDLRRARECLALAASGRGAAAMIVERGDSRLVAVWEPLLAGPESALRSQLASALERSSPAEVVAQCRDDGASVVVAQLRGREVQLVGWAAPSVLRVVTERAGLTPLPVPTVVPVSVRLRPGELLVLCSPGLLVQPPACLHAEAAALCPAGGPDAWGWAWRGLVEPLGDGAVALLQAD